MKKYFLHIVFCFLSLPFSFAQTLSATNYTTKKGLSSDEVYSLIQSKDGLIWIGSDAGLSSFDGIKFTHYPPPPSSRNKSMTGIAEGPNGYIWCHNFASQIFFFKDDSLHLWKESINHGALEQLSIEDSILVMKYTQGYLHYDLHKKTTSPLSNDKRIKLSNNKDLVFNLASGFRIDSANSSKSIPCPLCYYRKRINTQKPNKLYHSGKLLKKDNLVLFYTHKNFRSDLYNSYGKIDLSTANIPFVFQLKGDKFEPLHMPKEISDLGASFVINHLDIINDSLVWIASPKGLLKWNINANTFDNYLSEQDVSFILKDRENSLWVSTLNKGIYFIPFEKIKLYPFINQGKSVYHLTKDSSKSRLMIGYGDGSVQYWDIAKQKQLFEHQFLLKKKILNISYNPILNDFLISSNKVSLDFSATKNKIKNPQIAVGSVKDVAFDSFNNYLVAVGHGALVFHGSTQNDSIPLLPISWKNSDFFINLEKVRKAYPDRMPFIALDSFHTRAYTIATQNNPNYTIWVGYSNGLRYYTDGKSYSLETKNKEKIIAKDLCPLGDSILWVGTANQGVYAISNYQITTQITTQQGLPSNEIKQIKIYNNILWINTSNGLAQYDLKAKTIKVWNRKNLMPIDDIKDFALIDKDIFMTDGENIISIPIDLESTKQLPIIKIVGLDVNSVPQKINSNLTLPYYQNNIKLKFRGLFYKSQGNFVYKYRLKGVEKDWNYTSSVNEFINYPELQGGDYTFEIAVLLPNGVESKIAKLEFRIRFAFYYQWWFIILVLFTIGLFIFYLFQYQIKKLNTRNEEKLRQSNLERDLRTSELKAIKAQLNPHFIFNALNSIQDYILINEKELASDYLGKFADLMRIYLDHSQEKLISIKEEIEALSLYLELEAVRMNNQLFFDIDIASDIDIYQSEIPTMMLQPYVENAIKHGLFTKKGAKNIWISFATIETDFLLILIKDNGIGRAASGEINKKKLIKHKSFATSAIQSRLELFNYQKDKKIETTIIDLVENGVAQGTEIRIKIPF